MRLDADAIGYIKDGVHLRIDGNDAEYVVWLDTATKEYAKYQMDDKGNVVIVDAATGRMPLVDKYSFDTATIIFDNVVIEVV